MATAADRVFETYELLEHVIASIDTPRSIFVIQRICKTWRDIVQRSDTTQRLVFAAPEEDAAAPRRHKAPHYGEYSDITYTRSFRRNFLIPQHSLPWAERPPWEKDESVINVATNHLYEPLAHNPAASYRKLYLTRPPTTTVRLQALRSGNLVTDSVAFDVRDKAGITYGAVEDLIHTVATEGNTQDAKRVRFLLEMNVPTNADIEAVMVECRKIRLRTPTGAYAPRPDPRWY